MTTVLPFTTCEVVVTVAPEPPEVVTGPPTCGALAVGAPAAFVAEVDDVVVVLTGKEWVARATVVAPVPTSSAAAVQFDMVLTRFMPLLRARRTVVPALGPPGLPLGPLVLVGGW